MMNDFREGHRELKAVYDIFNPSFEFNNNKDI
jgi:hypothetical protein